MSRKREANAATAATVVLAGSVAVSALFPVVEHVLNGVFGTLLAAEVAFFVFVVVRDLWL